MAKKKISMTIDEDVFNDFKKYCEENGMKISTKVELMMKTVVRDISLNRFMKKEE